MQETTNLRVGSRFNPTIVALIARGFTSDEAESLKSKGCTLSSLQQMQDAELLELGLSADQVGIVHAGPRPAIPINNVAKVLWANRFVCCVCRDAGKAIILHHISPWAVSRNHAVKNLAVLCLEHHAQAHRSGSLEQNLSVELLAKFKTEWESQVAMLDPMAIREATRIESFHWWWFNHLRILELANALGIDVTRSAHFLSAQRHADLLPDGQLGDETHARPYLYNGGDGILLYEFMRAVLDQVLSKTAIFDISNDLDKSFLSRVVKPGDLILISGRHRFKIVRRGDQGPGQVSMVSRRANNIEMSFVADRWEAVSTSSWAGWLRGTQSASSIARVVSVSDKDGMLQLKCTGIAIGGLMEGMLTRSYLNPSCPQNRYKDFALDFDETW